LTRARLAATLLPLDGFVDGTAALLANLTVVNPAAAGFVDAPCGTGEPPVSSVYPTWPGGANLTLSPSAPHRRACTPATTDVLVDLVGTFGPVGIRWRRPNRA
jgi:hypothetical protein